MNTLIILNIKFSIFVCVHFAFVTLEQIMPHVSLITMQPNAMIYIMVLLLGVLANKLNVLSCHKVLSKEEETQK